MRRLAAALVLISALVGSPVTLAQKGGGKAPGPTAQGWYDSTGKFVGNPAYSHGYTGALVPVGGDIAFVPMRIDRTAAVPTWKIAPYSIVLFSTMDCTGPAYLPVAANLDSAIPGATKHQAVLLFGDIARLYLGGSEAAPTNIGMQSWLSTNVDSGTTQCALYPTVYGGVVPVVSTQDLSGLWTPPFAFR